MLLYRYYSQQFENHQKDCGAHVSFKKVTGGSPIGGYWPSVGLRLLPGFGVLKNNYTQ